MKRSTVFEYSSKPIADLVRGEVGDQAFYILRKDKKPANVAGQLGGKAVGLGARISTKKLLLVDQLSLDTKVVMLVTLIEPAPKTKACGIEDED